MVYLEILVEAADRLRGGRQWGVRSQRRKLCVWHVGGLARGVGGRRLEGRRSLVEARAAS